MKSKHLLIIGITSLISLNSCVTANKCNEKFPPYIQSSDTVIVNVSEDVFLKDVIISPIPTNLSYKTQQIAITRDTVVVSTNDTIIITNTVKNGNLTTECSTTNLEDIIKALKIKIQKQETTITQKEQLYTDVKAENKQLKILTKSENENAKANKFNKLSKVLMWLFLIIALFTFVFSIFKFKK